METEIIRAAAVEFLLLQKIGSFFALGLLDLRRAKGGFLIDTTREFQKRTGFEIDPRAEGLTAVYGKTRVILYDDSVKSRERRNFTIAHEIGHLLLGHVEEGENEKREANRFASEVLIPRAAVYGWEKREGRRMDAEEMRRHFSASREVCRRRREELDLDTLPFRENEKTLLWVLFSDLPEKSREDGE